MCVGGTVPEEIVTDVLSRLPVKSLCRFKCVSRSWKTLISDPYFAKAHLNRTNTNNPKQFAHDIILLSRTSTSQDFYSVDLTANVPIATKFNLPWLRQHRFVVKDSLGSCNGLLLFLFSDGYGNCDYFLLNPSTRESKKLPTPPLVTDFDYYNAYGVGYDSSKDDYKVVMSYYDDEFESESESEYSTLTSDITFVAVYSLKTNAWRRIQSTRYRLVSPTSSVYFNGCLHWLCSRDGYYLMVAFDLADEIFREVSLPALIAYDDWACYLEVVIVGDCLCLVHVLSSGSKIEVWTMKEYGVGASWTKIMIDRHDMNLAVRGRVLSGLLAEDEFLFSLRKILPRGANNQLVVYNPKKGTLRDILICGTPTDFAVMGTYVESLVSPNQCYNGEGIG